MKITGIKKAIGEYRSWLAGDWGRCANIMIDLEDGSVWCDCFISCNEWKEYHSKSIVSLSSYITERTDEKISMKLLKEYAERYITEQEEK